jgi:hypothetical protein
MRMYRWVRLGVSAATVAATLSVGGVAHAATETDIALHAATTATVLGVTAANCTAGSGPNKAVDGASSNINTDKWCVPTGLPTLTINLSGSAYGFSVSHIVVKHAGVAGESATFNTRAFRLRVVQTSSPTPLTVATVTGNPANQTSNTVSVGMRVLVLSPFGGRSRHPLDWGMHLAAQVEELRARGSNVESIFPDSYSLNAFGDNMMDLSARPPAARAGYNQGRALAEQLIEFWR